MEDRKIVSALIVTSKPSEFAAIKKIMENSEFSIQSCETGKAALLSLEEKGVELVVLQETLPDMTAKQCIEKIIQKNPMINCAVASEQPKKEFHDHYEGLGVLAQLSASPNTNQAFKLVDQLAKIYNLQQSNADLRSE